MIDGPIQRENLYDMDNKNKQDPNMKSNWQTITMLLIAALLTFGLVSWMNSYLNSKKRQELSYNEFVKMVDGGEVESIKSVNKLFMPVDGEVTAVNGELDGTPTLLNVGCYDKAWLIRIKPANPADIDRLLDADAYKAVLAK